MKEAGQHTVDLAHGSPEAGIEAEVWLGKVSRWHSSRSPSLRIAMTRYVIINLERGGMVRRLTEMCHGSGR